MVERKSGLVCVFDTICVNLHSLAHFQVNYKLRDWLFARQRYWGEPIPVIFLDGTSESVPLNETELPLTLPELDDFTPTGTGEPPLSKAKSWVCFLFLSSHFSKFCTLWSCWLVSFTLYNFSIVTLITKNSWLL